MQNNGHDCGVFVCRYAYNLFLMRNMKFTWAGSSTFRNSITNGAAFQFDMGDIARIRKELGMLIRKLSVIYLREHIVASLDEDIFDNNNTDWDVEDATNVFSQTSIDYSTFDDHGGKAGIEEAIVETTRMMSQASTEDGGRKKSRHREKSRRWEKQEKRPKLNIFEHPSYTQRSGRSGRLKLMDHVSRENARLKHPKTKKKNMTDKMKKERKKARETDKVLSDLVKDGKMEYAGQVLAEGNGIPFSQITNYVAGRVPDQDGDNIDPPLLLCQFRRGNTDLSSSDDDSGDGGSQQGK